MRKFFAILTVVFCIGFTGCLTKAAAAEPSNMPAEKELSAYLIGVESDIATAKAALEGAGFEVIAEHNMKKVGTTLVFTNDALKAMSNKPMRGFAAVLRLFIDKKRKQISITNPVYFGKAFMQDEYDHATSNSVLTALKKAFADLKPNEDVQEFDALAEYHFMMGMPFYADVDDLAEGDQATLVGKAENYKKGKHIVFELKLAENRVLFGYKLGKRTAKFTKKIGTQNSALLPYMILVEDGKAISLAAKYYLAISYPKLTMSEFMTIATVPGAIEKDLSKPFRK